MLMHRIEGWFECGQIASRSPSLLQSGPGSCRIAAVKLVRHLVSGSVDVRVPLFQRFRDRVVDPIRRWQEISIGTKADSSLKHTEQLSSLPHVCACVLSCWHDDVWMRTVTARRVVAGDEMPKVDLGAQARGIATACWCCIVP